MVKARSEASLTPKISPVAYSTVTVFARFRG
jgi:hypothetical protein